MSDKNKHGLSRHIHPQLKKQIRQEAGFGCVVCGLAIGEYEHIAPEFADAERHDPEKMTFLCSQCHAKVTRKFLSKEAVWKAKEKPFALNGGKPHETFHIGDEWPEVKIGNVVTRQCESLITVNGRSLLGILPPEEAGGPFRINAVLDGVDGQEVLRIKDNAWASNSDLWDVEAKGGRIVFKTDKGGIAIELEVAPGTINFNKLVIGDAGYVFRFSEGDFVCESVFGEKYQFRPSTFDGYASAILFEDGTLAMGADGKAGCSATQRGATVNAGATQDQMRAIFQAKLKRFGMGALASPEMGGAPPQTYKTACFVVR